MYKNWMEEGCEAMMARRQDTFFKGTVMVTSEMSNIFHVANGGCVTVKKIIVIAHVEDLLVMRWPLKWMIGGEE